MRGPELHKLLVPRPEPFSVPAGRALVAGEAEGADGSEKGTGAPRAPGAGETQEGTGARRQFASGGYQVHNGCAAAPVVVG